ncbi:MAG: M20/M25/M40 family metallo-hydrolase [Candidatus Methanomethylicia archaeon]|nr:M20/M25/M40 family metallo-hydrolase [Candidatus Methanomethylicia archaeon]
MLNSIYEYVDSNFDKFILELKDLCKIPSIAAQGIGIDVTVNKLVEMFNNVGFNVKVFKVDKGNPLVFAEYKPRSYKRTLLFYNHYDVQPPDPLELWITPPFEPSIRDGKIYARGIADNKGNIIARLKAIESILKVFGDIPIAIKFVIEGEEEIGSPSLQAYVEKYGEYFLADAGIWEFGYRDVSGRPIITLGVRGIAYFEFKVKGPKVDVHSGQAAIIPNPVWRLIYFLSSLRSDDGIILINGFYDNLKPIEKEDEELLKSIPFDDVDLMRRLEIKSFIGGVKGFEALKTMLFNPTCNIDGIYAGYIGPGAKTIIPSYAIAKVDFRLPPGLTPKDVFNKLKKHMNKYGFNDIEIISFNGYEAAKTDPKSEIVSIGLKSAREIYGLEPIVYPISSGSGPMYLFVNKLKIPMISIGVGYHESNTHSPNENIRLEDFKLGIKQIIRIIDMFGSI